MRRGGVPQNVELAAEPVLAPRIESLRMTEVIAEEAGVRLVFKDVAPTRSSGKGGAHYRLTTMRPNQARVFADRHEALEEYEREVRASLDDPVVRKIFARLVPRA